MEVYDRDNKVAAFIIFAVIMLVGFALLGFRVVRYNEYAYEYELGNLKMDIKEPGIRWIGIGQLKRISNQYMNYNTKVDASTKDMQGVDFDVNVKLITKKDRAYEFFKDYPSMDSFKNYLESKIQEKSKTVLFKYNAEELLGNRLEITRNVLDSLKELDGVDYFEIKDFAISNIQFSGDFDAILERKAQVMIERGILEQQKENMRIMRENVDMLDTEDYLRYQIAEKWDGKASLIISDSFIMKG